MRAIIILVFSLMFFNISAQGIVSYGVKAGLTYDATNGLIKSFSNSVEDIKSESKGSGSVGLQAGMMFRVKVIGLFVQPELLYTSYKTNFEISGEDFDISKKRIDIPVALGGSFLGLFHAQAGPVFSYYLTNDISLKDIKEVEQDNFHMGFQLGAGMEFSQFIFDIRYEFGLGKFATSFVNENTTFQTNNRPSLLHFSIGYLF